MRAVDPVTITTTDGEERRLLLTFGAHRRFQQAVTRDKESVMQDAGYIAGRLLYDCLVNKGDLTEEQFLDVLPMNAEFVLDVMQKLGVVPQEALDTLATTAPEARMPEAIGSASGPMPVKSSGSRRKNSGA